MYVRIYMRSLICFIRITHLHMNAFSLSRDLLVQIIQHHGEGMELRESTLTVPVVSSSCTNKSKAFPVM